MWNPDADLLEQSRRLMRDALDALASEPDDELREEEAAILLEAAGTLSGLGADAEVLRSVEGATAARAACEAYLDALDLGVLDEAALRVSRDANALMLLDPEEGLELATKIDRAFEQRDRVELLRMGAQLLCPQHVFDAEQESAWLTFDQLVGAELWRLLSLGDSRWVPSAWMHPDKRARFPWRTRGYGLGRKALDALADAAEVLVHFPEARAHFDGLIATISAPGRQTAASPGSSAGDAAQDTAPACAVIDLRAYRQARAMAPNGKLRAAAADDGADIPEVELDSVEGLMDLSLRGANTLVAYVLPEDAGVPRLEWAGQSLQGELIAGSARAYRLTLPDAERVELVIVAAGRERRVEVRR